MIKPFRERDPILIGVVGALLIAVLLGLALNADKLPLIGGGHTYHADFSEVGGLKRGDDVRLAGVLVGKVKSLELRGDRVRVAMSIDQEHERLGPDSAAAIRIKTLLGRMYVALEPAGSGQLDQATAIPVERTTPPYDIVQAFSDFAATTEEIDTDQLAHALDTMSAIGEKTPKAFRGSLKGIQALSDTLASRDEQIKTLLANVESFTGVLAERNTELTTMFADGDLLFRALEQRRQAIHDVLVATRTMSEELSALITDTEDDLKPALDQLTGVVKVLEENEKNISQALSQMPAYYRAANDATGNGPWLDGLIYNLLSLMGVPGGL